MTMQLLPFAFSDLSLFLALSSIILFITAELTEPNFGLPNLDVDKKKLQISAFAAGALFFVTAGFQVLQMITNP
jgi:hypothetical protein